MATLIERTYNLRKYETLPDFSEDSTIIANAKSKGWKLQETQNHIDGHFLVFKPYDKFVSIDNNDKHSFNKQRWIDEHVKPEIIERLKASRDMMLTDIVELMTQTQYDEWKEYRQDLRDLPSQIVNATTPKDIVWPTKPTTPDILEVNY